MNRNMRILIIDDIKDNILILKSLIRKRFPGTILLSAISGDLGIELAVSTSPDIIFLDILMPVKDGFQVCKEIKRNKELVGIPVVFVTALKANKDSKIKAIESGADGFLMKPVDESELYAQVNAMFKVRMHNLQTQKAQKELSELVDQKTKTLGVELEKRLETEKSLTSSEKRYRELVNNLNSGVVVHNPDTSVRKCNLRASEILDLSIKQMIGEEVVSPLWNFVTEAGEKIHPIDYPVSIVRKTESPLKNHIIGILHNKKQAKWVNVNGVPIFENGKIVEIVISFVDITAEKEKEKQLVYAANFDYLTNLHSRRYYEMALKELDVEENYPLTVAIADVNGLKLINDAFGHEYGDKFIIEAAYAISEPFTNKDVIARIGGDEFAVIMPNTTELEAEGKIRRIHQIAKSKFIQSVQLSIAIGYKTKTSSETSIFELTRAAEDLMYRQKLLEIPSMRSSTIETILNTLYEKDKNSEKHSRSVSTIAERLASAHGLSDQDSNDVKTAGLLHDIGKIIIPISIINKVGKLTTEEFTEMKNHPEIGFRILNSSTYLRTISDIVLNHHERWDGKGYPRGLKGDKTLLKARIISIADAFDAMTNERSYRIAVSKEEALQEIQKNAGTQFDPNLVITFANNFENIVNFENKNIISS